MILAATGLRREARIVSRPEIIALAGGGDAARLEAALEAHIGQAQAVLSIGLAGALVCGLRPGDWLIGDAVHGLGEADPYWTWRIGRLFPKARRGTVYADGAMVPDAADKQALHLATGAIAVDMESHVAARVASRHKLPLAILRIISDDAEYSLPPAARVGMDRDGNMALGRVLASLARHPWQLPALVGTAIKAEIAFRSLARGYDVLARFGFALPDRGEFPLDMG